MAFDGDGRPRGQDNQSMNTRGPKHARERVYPRIERAYASFLFSPHCHAAQVGSQRESESAITAHLPAVVIPIALTNDRPTRYTPSKSTEISWPAT